MKYQRRRRKYEEEAEEMKANVNQSISISKKLELS
jgi:hypothetical protein